LFATAHIKIGSVVSDPFGKTGRNRIGKLIDTDTELKIEHVEQCAEGSLKRKVAELFRAIQGFFEAHHRFQLKIMMQTIAHLESEIEAITKRLERYSDKRSNKWLRIFLGFTLERSFGWDLTPKGFHRAVRQMTLPAIPPPLVFHTNGRYRTWPHMTGITVFSHLQVMRDGRRRSGQIGSP